MIGCCQGRPEEALDDVADSQQGLCPPPRASSCQSQQRFRSETGKALFFSSKRLSCKLKLLDA